VKWTLSVGYLCEPSGTKGVDMPRSLFLSQPCDFGLPARQPASCLEVLGKVFKGLSPSLAEPFVGCRVFRKSIQSQFAPLSTRRDHISPEWFVTHF
jgi:hypothetical protein